MGTGMCRRIAAAVARVAASILVASIAACGPTDKARAAGAERQRIHCLEHFCPGDREPARDSARDELLKLDGRWFIGPQSYFSSGMNGGSFYWPSGRALRSEVPGNPRTALEKLDEDVIEIFLRSYMLPTTPTGYALIQLAEKNDWIAERRTLRPGLEQIRMKHVLGPRDLYIDDMTYYVATELTGTDGLPPVAQCNHDDPRNGGGTGFLWQDRIWAGIRMNQQHCADWPEIYQTLMSILALLREAEQ